MADKSERDADKREAASEPELRRRIAQLERENRRLRERCEETELENAQLTRSLRSVEETLSFRLGHALIQSTKSVQGLRALPRVLAELRKDKRRKKPAENEHSLLTAALRTSAGYAKQVASPSSRRKT